MEETSGCCDGHDHSHHGHDHSRHSHGHQHKHQEAEPQPPAFAAIVLEAEEPKAPTNNGAKGCSDSCSSCCQPPKKKSKAILVSPPVSGSGKSEILVPVDYQVERRHGVSYIKVHPKYQNDSRVPPPKQELSAVKNPKQNFISYIEPVPQQIVNLENPLMHHDDITFDVRLEPKNMSWDMMRFVIQEFVKVSFERSPVSKSDCKLLSDDITGMLQEYLGVEPDRRFVHLRLEVARHEGCLKFHTDVVRYRAIRTYFGHGTLYVPNDSVDRKAMKRMFGVNYKDSNPKTVPDSSKIRITKPGEVLYMKGSVLCPMGGCVHKAPLKDNWDTTRRLIVKMDTRRD